MENESSETLPEAARMMVISEQDGYVTTLQTINGLNEVKSDFESPRESVSLRMMITNVSQQRRRLDYSGPRVVVYRKVDRGTQLKFWSSDERASPLSTKEVFLGPSEEITEVVELTAFTPGIYRLDAKITSDPMEPVPPKAPLLEFEVK